ncbi:hypothetical protein NPIL_405711 [Nephila pilipes]|uniref:Uncharacterized protein n=1 Tax=Nephila pilipes TaxID=299642 RepID=A0A8X6U1D2_NEPPI|nr:hypothetical protein NPIL_405711 [Nephila pilipes]
MWIVHVFLNFYRNANQDFLITKAQLILARPQGIFERKDQECHPNLSKLFGYLLDKQNINNRTSRLPGFQDHRWPTTISITRSHCVFFNHTLTPSSDHFSQTESWIH